MIEIFDDTKSPNRLIAASALVLLGDYRGYGLLSDGLASKRAHERKLCAATLGDIAEEESLLPLKELYDDNDRTVRVIAAASVLFILGLEPKVLAEQAVDWARTAIASEDWRVRRAAARTIRDLPGDEAVPLLAQAIADDKPEVRRASAQSAAAVKTPAAADIVAGALANEKDDSVKESQVIALAEIGIARDAVMEVLATAAEKLDRVGVLALGSLIRLGDSQMASRLDAAYDNRKPAIRLAAIESATLAGSAIVLPILTGGLSDRVFEIRFAAAEGLAGNRSADKRAIEVLTQGLDAAPKFASRAMAALLVLEVEVTSDVSPDDMIAEMLDSADVVERQAAIPLLTALPWQQASPHLWRAVKNSAPEVRSDAIDAVAGFAEESPREVRKLYKAIVSDGDEADRGKARAQLARLPPPDGGVASKSEPGTNEQASEPDLEALETAASRARETWDRFEEKQREVESLLQKLSAKMAESAQSDSDIDEVEALGKKLTKARASLLVARDRVADETAATRNAAAALQTPSPEAETLIANVTEWADRSNDLAARSERDVVEIRKRIDTYVAKETADPTLLLLAAEAAIAAGRLSAARRDLKKLDRIYRKKGEKNPRLHFIYGQYHDKRALDANSDRARLKELGRAKKRYQRFVRASSDHQVEQARGRITEIDEEIADIAKSSDTDD